MKVFYENYWKIRGKSGTRPRYKIFSEWIEKGASVLDIGCGDGYFGEFLVEKNKVDYTGCDISEAALEIAENRGLKIRHMAIVNKIDFPDKVFDYVLMSEFLEHIVDSEEVLTDAMRVARKGVMVSIPNIAYWRFRLELLLGNFPKQWAVAPKEHLRYWSVNDFHKMIKSLGFKVNKIKSSNGRKRLRDWWPNLFGLQVCFHIIK